MISIRVVNDLRSALEVLRQMDGQLVETDIEVDPEAELAGVYRHVGSRRYGHASDEN